MVDWMGRYRQLVAAIVQHTNVITKAGNESHFMYEGIYMTSNEWQVMEYIVEHREDDEKMIRMSEALGIPQSSFSKIIKHMSTLGLVERYRSIDNKKNVILKPTELAIRVYEYHAEQSYNNVFKAFFDALDGISDSDLETLANAISLLSSNIKKSNTVSEEKAKLIKIE